VVFGGIHATLYPDEAQDLGGAHAVVRGDGDVVWPMVIDHAVQGTLQRRYEGGRVDADRFVPARWDLLPSGRYMWGSVQTVRGCPETLFVLLGVAYRRARSHGSEGWTASSPRSSSCVVRGFRFVALADDNFYPVTLADLAMAERQGNASRLEQLRAVRASDSS
jgi:hypothetical protein